MIADAVQMCPPALHGPAGHTLPPCFQQPNMMSDIMEINFTFMTFLCQHEIFIYYGKSELWVLPQDDGTVTLPDVHFNTNSVNEGHIFNTGDVHVCETDSGVILSQFWPFVFFKVSSEWTFNTFNIFVNSSCVNIITVLWSFRFAVS